MRTFLFVMAALLVVAAALVACSRQAVDPVMNGDRVELALVSDVPALAAEAMVSFDGDRLRFVGLEPMAESVLSLAQEMGSGLVRLVLVTTTEEPVASGLVRLSFEALADGDHELEVAWIVTDEDLVERPFTKGYRAEPVLAGSEVRPASAADVTARAAAVLPSSVPSDAELEAEFANFPLGDVNASGAVSGPDAVIITRIVSGVITDPSDHQRYHADLNSSGTIDTFDVLVVMRKWLDENLEAQLQVAPRVVRPSPDAPALILIGNAGNQPLPPVRAATSSAVLQEVTGVDAVGQVYEVSTDWQGATGVITFDAGSAGAQAVSLNVRPIAPGDPPDPSRYFSVVVTDMLRNAVPNADARAIGIRDDDSYSFWGWTDDEGVAVLADFDGGWYQAGEYRIELGVRVGWGAAPQVSRVFASYGSLELPGSLDVDVADPRFRDLLLSVTDDGGSGSRSVSIGPDLRAEDARWTAFHWDGVQASQQVRYRVDPGAYELFFRHHPWDSDTAQGYYLRDAVTVDESADYVFDAVAAPAFTFEIGFGLADEDASTEGWWAWYSADLVEDGSWNYPWYNASLVPFIPRSVRFTPGEYHVRPRFSHSVYDGSEEVYWDYGVVMDGNPQDFTPAGGEAAWAFGGMPTLSIVGLESAYQPGSEVAFGGELLDGNANLIDSVWHSIWDDDTGQWLEPETMHVLITDPEGAVVFDESYQGWYYGYMDIRYALPTDAPEGTYEIEFRADTGPYAGELVATSTFDVGETGETGLGAGAAQQFDERRQAREAIIADIEHWEARLLSYTPEPDDPASAAIERWQQRILDRATDREP